MNGSDELDILTQLHESPELMRAVSEFEGKELTLQTKLRESHSPEVVRAAISLHEARHRAKSLLPGSENLWLTSVSLQQSTAWQVAQHKAKRFPEGRLVHDLCSGIGVDTAALLKRGPVISVDSNEAMLRRCQWNLEYWAKTQQILSTENWSPIVDDVHNLNVSDKLIHVDPDRRTQSDRPAKRLEHYCPSLNWMQETVTSGASGALKLGPASNFIGKFPNTEIELISLNGECREATVWFGSLAGPHAYRATSLPSGETISADPLSAWCPQVDAPKEFLFDPDPAVVRSGLLDHLGEMHNLGRLDKNDEYLTGGHIPDSAFVTPYIVEACLPNNLKDLRKYFRHNASIDYEIKCRHVRTDAAKVRRKLPSGSEPRRTIVFLRIDGRAKIVIAKRYKAAE